MNLVDLVPDADAVLALEPDELGLLILRLLDHWSSHQQMELGTFVNIALGNPQGPPQVGLYPANRRSELEQAIREAWAWLEGAALLIPDPRYMGSHTIRLMSR